MSEYKFNLSPDIKLTLWQFVRSGAITPEMLHLYIDQIIMGNLAYELLLPDLRSVERRQSREIEKLNNSLFLGG